MPNLLMLTLGHSISYDEGTREGACASGAQGLRLSLHRLSLTLRSALSEDTAVKETN